MTRATRNVCWSAPELPSGSIALVREHAAAPSVETGPVWAKLTMLVAAVTLTVGVAVGRSTAPMEKEQDRAAQATTAPVFAAESVPVPREPIARPVPIVAPEPPPAAPAPTAEKIAAAKPSPAPRKHERRFRQRRVEKAAPEDRSNEKAPREDRSNEKAALDILAQAQLERPF
jgi:hypothetical protein